MRQIKRAYTFTLTRLLTDSFFDNTEATESYGRLRKDDIQERVKAAYDLRSLYVHTGVDFGRWVHPLGHTLNEVQIPGLIVGGGERFGRAVRLAPTFFGLERVMRYCLLRFLHLHGVKIDDRLDGPAPSAGVAQEEVGTD